MIVWVCYGIVALIILQFCTLLIRIGFFWKNHSNPPSELPPVSVLVAARNEEAYLPDLLRSLENIDYPADKVEFLFADDQSSDRTTEILEHWCALAPNRSFISIGSSQTALYNENGKANALGILAEKAKGDYYFFTDADCEVGGEWIREGIGSFSGNIGLLIGVTQVKAGSMLGRLQELDWWLTLGFVKVATDLQIQTTGLGNNMVISQEAYVQCGGFKNLPFCLTEDLEISRAIQKEGYGIAHQVSLGILVKTKPETSLRSLMRQRKRWMHGMMTLPLYWKVVLGLQTGYYLGLIGLLILMPKVGLALALIKIAIQGLFLNGFANKAGQKINWIYLLFFDFYSSITTLLTILYYFWPSKTNWKARIYP
ncbi:glycosyltransferase [Algoriphagus sp. AGSA1]|uniref:glycosyltransferase n=1 Tax=Algoriphagus sp. AGSA1 TaxID=2907213 RepID=UPI001F280083|nr:glycosyltransferase [Algoriphagus sp. AGSA1]MCE7053951.1 glycosyltransferase [Algoriphagus sp. AGSA1]